MKVKNKTKKKLLEELEELRRKFSDLEISEAECISRESEIKKKIRHISSVHTIAQTAMDADQPSELARSTLEILSNVLTVDAFSFTCYDFPNNELVSILHADTIDGELEVWDTHISYQLEDNPLQTILENGEPSMILREPDEEIETDLLPFGDVKQRSLSLLFAPMRHKDKTRGIISVQSYKHNAYDCDDLNLLADVANVVGVALSRMRAEQVLHESEQRYRDLFEKSRDGFVVVDTEGGFIDANPAFCDMLGYTLDELKQKKDFYEITPPRWHDWEREEIWEKRLLHTGHSGVYEKEYIRRDGTVFPVELQSFTVFDDEGKPRYLWGIARDITERKRAIEALKESEEKYRTMFENTGAATVIIEDDTTLSLVNKRFEQLSGYSREEIEWTMSWTKFVVEEDLEIMKSYHYNRRKESDKTPNRYEFGFKDRKGKVHDILLEVDIIPGTSKSIASLLDITERKEAEERVREREARLKEAEKVARIGHWKLSLENDALYWSDGIYRIFEIEPSRFRGTHEAFLEMVHPEDKEYVKKAFSESIENKTLFSIDHRILLKNGTVKFVHNQCKTYYDEQGTALYSSGIIKDITERKQAEEELKTSQKNLRILSMHLAKSEEQERKRLAQELHDQVGQTLTGLGIDLNLICTRLPADTERDILNRLDDALEQVGHIAERIRDVMSELRPPVLDDYGLLAGLNWLCDKYTKRTGIVAKIKGCEPEPRLSAEMESALFRTTQEALTNIAKHANADRVDITLKKLRGNRIRLTIADNGAGFDVSSVKQTHKGWGLMSMKERAIAIGGKLHIKSKKGKGTRIIFESGKKND